METNLLVMKDCLIATVPANLNRELLESFYKNVLNVIQQKSINGVILDMGSVRIIDSYEFKSLSDLAKIIGIQGAQPAFIGLRPGVVSAIVDSKADTSEILSFRNLESALEYFGHNSPIQDESNNDDAKEEIADAEEEDDY